MEINTLSLTITLPVSTHFVDEISDRALWSIIGEIYDAFTTNTNKQDMKLRTR